jgi:LEA14-like dessication related protein
MRSSRPILIAAALGLAACNRGCAKPEPPTVRPVSGRVTGINNVGLEVEAKLEAQNPNDFDIQVRSFTSTVTLDQKVALGPVTSNHPVTLPANKKKIVDLPITVKWQDVQSLAPLALSSRDIPWEAEGTVKIDAESLEVSLPFKVNGVVTHQQLVSAVSKSLPKLPALPF